MQAEGHRVGRSWGVCRKHPSRAEGRVLREREQCVQRLRGLESRWVGCGRVRLSPCSRGRSGWVRTEVGTQRDCPPAPWCSAWTDRAPFTGTSGSE